MGKVSSDCVYDYVLRYTLSMSVLEIFFLNMIGTLFEQVHRGVLNFWRYHCCLALFFFCEFWCSCLFWIFVYVICCTHFWGLLFHFHSLTGWGTLDPFDCVCIVATCLIMMSHCTFFLKIIVFSSAETIN